MIKYLYAIFKKTTVNTWDKIPTEIVVKIMDYMN